MGVMSSLHWRDAQRTKQPEGRRLERNVPSTQRDVVYALAEPGEKGSSLATSLISNEERTWLLEHLRTVHSTMVEVAGHFSAVDWITAQVPGDWNPSQIVEHTLLVDEEILGQVRKHLADSPYADWEQITGRKEIVLKRYLPNIGRAQANAKTSTFRGLRQEDIRSLLEKSYQGVDEILSRNSELPLKAIIWPHGGMGPLNAYQWLLYIPLHAERHLNQLLRAARIADQVEWTDATHRWENVRP
ncbi:MAG: DinB family protein [Edaphobacter sp.]|uniref:DinB family protein n=1 Tax=Edaphobacter sp. TaxID=1934404 RepID=UPI00239FB4B1|nr:DinB family protein [Edaphobacter sp.]MDE1176347.1 DinB family protein [Edaphobacter sp.]